MWTKKKILWGVVVLAIASGVYFMNARETSDAVETETVRRTNISETVSVTGEVVPVEYADLSFKSVGIIDRVYVAEGDMVEAGQAIASVDRTVLQSQLNEARVAVAVAEENEKLARRTSSASKPETLRAKKLLTEQAREYVKTLVAQVKEGTLASPFAGQVSSLDVHVGETVTASKTIAHISKPGDFIIESRVPESDIAKMSVGMQATVTFDAFTEAEEYRAQIIDMDRTATVVQDVVSYIVKFRLENIDARLKEGMTANIDIITASRENVLSIPFRALTQENGKSFVEVRRGEDTFDKVEVTLGLEGDEGDVEITSGIKEGDAVTIGAKQKK